MTHDEGFEIALRAAEGGAWLEEYAKRRSPGSANEVEPLDSWIARVIVARYPRVGVHVALTLDEADRIFRATWECWRAFTGFSV